MRSADLDIFLSDHPRAIVAELTSVRGSSPRNQGTFMLAVTSVGGQLAKISVKIPDSTAGIFQAMMLFFILASDIFVRYRVRIVRTQKVAPAMSAGE